MLKIIEKLAPHFEKLAAHGAMGVAGGSMVAWLGMAWFIRPSATGGMDARGWLSGSAAALVLFGMIALAHFWFGVQLKKGPTSITG